MAASFPLSAAFRASSVDTEQRIPYNPHRTYPRKAESAATPLASVSSRSPGKSPKNLIISELLRRDIPQNTHVDLNGLYLGYDTWLPPAPKVERPKSVLNPASLAYIGDCVYELYARRHFLFPPLNLDEYNDRVMAVVRCEAQETMLQNLVSENVLSQEERTSECLQYIIGLVHRMHSIFMSSWQGMCCVGEKIVAPPKQGQKRAGAAVYSRATSLETLVGYLYLTDQRRLDEIMQKIGFSTDISSIPKTAGIGNAET